MINLVSEEMHAAIQQLTTETRQADPPPPTFRRDATHVLDKRRGYLQQLDEHGLADLVGDPPFHSYRNGRRAPGAEAAKPDSRSRVTRLGRNDVCSGAKTYRLSKVQANFLATAAFIYLHSEIH
jgi:hypothetical protein